MKTHNNKMLLSIILIGLLSFCFGLDYAPQEILVKLKAGTHDLLATTNASLANLSSSTTLPPFKILNSNELFKKTNHVSSQLQSVKASKQGQDLLTNIYNIELEKTENLQEALEWLKLQDNVVYAHLNYKAKMVGTVPNDTFYNFNQKTILDKYEMEDAWDISVGSSNIIVAIIDSGVAYDHPDLSGNVIQGYDHAEYDNDPMDYNGHGTHIAGIIAAQSNNSAGIAGIAWEVKLLAIKIFNDDGSGGYYSYIALAIKEAVDSGANVINLSLEGPYVATGVYQDALDYAYTNGVVVVAAAGNSNMSLSTTPLTPVCNDGSNNQVIGVASVGINYTKSSFSNYSSEYVDISSIGENIYSTVTNNTYGVMSGTSMATPMVCGLAALILSTSPNMLVKTSGQEYQTVEDVKSYLFSGATDIDEYSGKPGEMGYGLINAYNSLYLVKNTSAKTGSPSSITKFYNYPNPVSNSLLQNNTTKFHVLLTSTPTAVKLSIYAYSGVRVLNKLCQFNSVLITGAGEDFIWDLKDDNGNILPPGVYIAVLEVSDTVGSEHTDYHKVVIK